jgi:hypothetical protein
MLSREVVGHESIVDDREPYEALLARPRERRIRGQKNTKAPGRHEQREHDESHRFGTHKRPERLCAVREPRAA